MALVYARLGGGDGAAPGRGRRGLRRGRSASARRRLRTPRSAKSIMMPRMASIHSSKVILLVCIALTAACSGKPDQPAANTAPSANPVTSLQKITLKPGTGAAIGGGQTAVVQ